MAGTSDHGSLMEDWMPPPTPSPRTIMSSFLNDDFVSGSFGNFFSEHESNKPQDQFERGRELVGLSKEVSSQSARPTFQKDASLEPSLLNPTQRSNSHGGLAERRAARAGFSVPKIDTSRAGSSTVVRSPVAIPPGLSPTTLLESPVFLYNAMAQPSPTTGKLPFLMGTNAKSTIPPTTKMDEDCAFGNDTFSFQPHVGSRLPNFAAAEKESSLQSSFTAVKDTSDEKIVKTKISDSKFGDNHSFSDEQEDDETNQNGEFSSAAMCSPAEDGYSWRKYGQKQVKNNENPRSYYKCTQTACTVRKKVEYAQDGQITQIIYKGAHNHPMPPPNHRSGVPLSHTNDLEVNVLDNRGPQAGLNSASLWNNSKNDSLQDVQSEVIETTTAACRPQSSNCDTSIMESQDAVDVSSTLSNEDDRATHGTASIECSGDGDETDSKRRKLDALTAATAAITTTSNIDMGVAASRGVREPRVVVQTTSEVDILDDGYRWRKYGQKVVKGNPNPRSYYKCTHQGCSVRKHVERASHDLKSVITTYEGKHNHEVPAARNSGHGSSGSGSAPSAPQVNSSQRRQEPAQASFGQFGGTAPFSSFVLPPRNQFGPAASNFAFGMVPPGMAIPMPPLGPLAPTKMVGHPSTMQGFQGLMMPEGEMKTEPMLRPSFPAVNQSSSSFQQMMNRPPFGPQM
ncbi:probable WRKY transcription factor 3 isoform X2 [Oryza brachyantha]|uniref:WRKY transcription factor WRKY24 n=1 Tax=Oryza brachyantha TaxID=4533 RepID=J3MYJ7_ORYBR|nr:probable WRKY transcription factor 3 isoform X2 [Oryza brachyantha]